MTLKKEIIDSDSDGDGDDYSNTFNTRYFESNQIEKGKITVEK